MWTYILWTYIIMAWLLSAVQARSEGAFQADDETVPSADGVDDEALTSSGEM